MGPLCFVSYTEEITDLFDKHRVQSHIYADDNQLYGSCRAEEVNATRDRLLNCTADVARWCASRRLQLNSDKTEVIWFGSRAALKKLKPEQRTIQFGSSTIQSSAAVRYLGVQLDADLSMKQHINKTVAVCYFHLRRLRQIHRRVGSEVTTRLVQAFILSRLDYCNSMLAALPESTIRPLQHVQNAAAHLIFGLRTSDHITDSLIQLHWLPIRWHIQYKLCLTMHSIYRNSDRSHTYLADMVQPASTRSTRRLRSRESGLFDVPRLHTKLGERAFSFSGPSAWNALPIDIRDETCTAAFKRKLKTFYFSQAFDCV